MGKIRPFVGDLVEDDELYVGPGLRMPTLAGSLVVQARQRTNLTQAGLAERAGTSRSAISAIEHGKRDPGLEGLQKILRAAGFDLHTRLAPRDDHDDSLKALGARLTLRSERSAAPPPEISTTRPAPPWPTAVRSSPGDRSSGRSRVPRRHRLQRGLQPPRCPLRDGSSLGRAKMWNLQCAHGAIDITFEPSGGGYDHLAARAHLVTLRGVEIPVADLADIVASKKLANRPKDQLVLPQLERALYDRRETPNPGHVPDRQAPR